MSEARPRRRASDNITWQQIAVVILIPLLGAALLYVTTGFTNQHVVFISEQKTQDAKITDLEKWRGIEETLWSMQKEQRAEDKEWRKSLDAQIRQILERLNER